MTAQEQVDIYNEALTRHGVKPTCMEFEVRNDQPHMVTSQAISKPFGNYPENRIREVANAFAVEVKKSVESGELQPL